ncbi:2-nitropropane dioxygenase [Lyophyllum atratum]|nr:2-nitropropane dioxygenase [Lyophyllum atratum]
MGLASDVKLPILSAPMAFASAADLASSVTAASAFGFMGAGFLSSEELKRNLRVIRKKLDVGDTDPVPVGIGFIGWILEHTEASEDPRINAILEEKPVAIWFAFGLDLGKYVAQVREYDAKREHKTVIFVNVNSVEDALRAANEWKVDVLVAQGMIAHRRIEAGGHGGSEAPPLLTLLQAILQALPDGPLVVAAGGVSTGSQAAALLTMGAAGVVLGTRFLFTTECTYPPEKKDALLQAGLNSTTRTLAFDEVGRTMGWPPKHDGRAIANHIIRDVEEGLDLEQRLQKFDESAASGDSSRLIVWAGVGVGLTNKITSAAVGGNQKFSPLTLILYL